MRIDQLLNGARQAAAADRRNRRERIALECLKVLLFDQSAPWESDPIGAAVKKAIHAADLLIAGLETKGGAK